MHWYVAMTPLVWDGTLMMAPSVQLLLVGGGLKPPPVLGGFVVAGARLVPHFPSYDDPL